MNKPFRQFFRLILLTIFASACTTARQIDVLPSVTPLPPTFSTFEMDPESLPAFLGPVLISNFAVALAEHGYEPVVNNGDVVITLRLHQEQLGQEPTKQRGSVDDFAEQIDTSGETRFIARIVVEVRSKGEPGLLWTGSIQRLHTIRAGDYMHMGPASNAFLQAFRELLVNYPGPPD